MGSLQSTGGADAGIWSDMPTLLAAAHELKSPLVLIRQLSFQLADTDTTTAERIRVSAERSLHLVEGLTRVARLDDALFECEPIYIPSLYDEVAHELTPLARAMGQRIEVRVPSSAPTAVGNRTLLRSVLLGLADNALAHNDHEKPIRLTSHRAHDRVWVSVRDFGPSTDHMRAIRKSIGRTPLPMSARPRSSGLGLMIAEQFARHMDASLHIRRHHSAGLTCSLSLPASKQLNLFSV